MRSRIYTGRVMHARKYRASHEFVYPVYFYAFDLDELAQLDREVTGFGYNRFRPVSLHDADYLSGDGTIREKLDRLLRAEGLDGDVHRVELVTAARYFGYVFNPVSFYYCYGESDELLYVVSEINNTFGERHVYVHARPLPARNGFLARYRHDKTFHVSPFNDMNGTYEFHFSPTEGDIDIRINLSRDGELAFKSRLWGDARPLTARNLAATIARYPITAALTMPRILLEAAKLRTIKKLPHLPKPAPASRHTIGVAGPNVIDRWAMKQVFKVLSHIETGMLAVELPGGGEHRFGSDLCGVHGHMRVHDYRFFRRVAVGGGNAFGDAYVDGWWDSDDPVAVLRVFADNMGVLEKQNRLYTFVNDMRDRIAHVMRRNTPSGSRRNISAHYDLSNDFFRTFLDPTMTYSCAVFPSEDATLEQAQYRKLHRIIEQARITADHHVLEIGTGWGSMAMELVRMTGCRVTTVTISEEQHRLAVERIREAGMEERIEVRLCDYRHIEGRFDRIVSVEMLEAVGHDYYPDFFASCDRLLKRDGLAVIQVITIPDQRYHRYRRKCDWIQKRIFPGAMLPSLTALTNAMTKGSDLVVENVTNIGPHYARTLREWADRVEVNEAAIRSLGFDDHFLRTWRYYLNFCEAGFAARALGTLQIVLTRANNRSLADVDYDSRPLRIAAG